MEHDEKLMIPIEPFINPQNAFEKSINVRAIQIYESKTAREKMQYVDSMFMHQEKIGHVYRISFGWTEQGWRTFAVEMDMSTVTEMYMFTMKFASRYAEIVELAILKGEYPHGN